MRDVTINCLGAEFGLRMQSSLIMLLQASECFSMMQSIFSNAMQVNLSLLITYDDLVSNSFRHGAVVTKILQPL